MALSSPQQASGCSPTPNGDLPRRIVLGRIAGANEFWTGLSPAGCGRPRQCAEPEPAGHRDLRPAHERSALGGRTGKRAVDRLDDGPAERFGRERDADHRPRSVASRRTHGPDFVGQARSAACRHRHRPRSLGTQTALADDRIAKRQRNREECRGGAAQARTVGSVRSSMSVATRTLLDTNQQVHRYDGRFPDRQRIATQVLRDGITSGSTRIAHQSIVEFVAATPRIVLTSRLLDAVAVRRDAEESVAKFPIPYPHASELRTAYGLFWFYARLQAFADVHGVGPKNFSMAACTARCRYEAHSCLFRRPLEAPPSGQSSSPSWRSPAPQGVGAGCVASE